MSKNKKNKKTRNNVPLGQLEQKARDHLQKGDYRKAKDGFKELCKDNREKYLPELIKSYEGLAKQMLENSQTTEAQTVIDHIKTLDPDFDDNTVKTQINIKKGDNDTAINEYIEYLSSGRNDLDNVELLKAADMMVTTFKDFPSLSSNRPDLSNDLRAITDAIECVSVEKFDAALDIIRKIKRNSLFSHWKLFVKGMVAFYTKDDVKANNAFTMLPENTLPYKAAKPFLLIMNDGALVKQSNSDMRLISDRACMLTGLPECRIVTKADYLWKTGRYRDSFQYMLDNHKDFPAEGSGPTANLTTFFLNSVYNIDHAAATKYMDYLFDNNTYTHHNHDLIRLLVNKLVANLWETDQDDYYVFELWKTFLHSYKKIHKKNKKLDSIVFTHLGTRFATVEESSDFSLPFFYKNKNRDNLRNSKLAIDCLEKSIECNGEDRDAYIELLKVYESIKEKSKLNRLLDTMISRFPEDKEILVRAGTACIDRKVYIKGVKYLEQAFKLDPLDSKTKDILIIGYLHIARNNFKKKKISAGRDSFKRAIEVGSSESYDFNIGHAYIYSRWAGLEFAYGSHEVGNEMMQTAQSLNVPHFSLLYFSLLIFKAYEVPQAAIENLEKDVKVELKTISTAETILQALKIIDYIELLDDFPWLSYEKKRIRSFAVKAAKNKDDKCSRNIAKEIIKLVFADQQRYRFNADFTIAQVYIKKMLRFDKNDPQFLFYGFMLQNFDPRRPPNRKSLKRIKKILTLAEERNEVELIKDIKREIEEIEKVVYNPFFGRHDNDEQDLEEMEEDIYNAVLSDIFNINEKDLYEMANILEDLDKKPKKATKSKKETKPSKCDNEDSKTKPKYKQLEFFDDY